MRYRIHPLPTVIVVGALAAAGLVYAQSGAGGTTPTPNGSTGPAASPPSNTMESPAMPSNRSPSADPANRSNGSPATADPATPGSMSSPDTTAPVGGDRPLAPRADRN